MSYNRSWRVGMLAVFAFASPLLSKLSLGQLVPQRQVQNQASQAPRAQAAEPAVVIAIGELSRSLPNVSYLMRACGAAEIGGMATLMANQFTQGLDKSRPSGIAVTVKNGDEPLSVVAFLPIQDRKKFFDALASMGKSDDLGNGLFSVAIAQQEVFAKEQGNWLHVARSKEDLAVLIADPTTLIKTIGDRYDLAIKIAVQNIPVEIKQKLMVQLRAGYEQSMAQQNQGKSPAEAAAADAMGKESIAQLERSLNEIDQFIIGWAVDSTGKKTYIDIGTQFLAGTKMEKEVAALSQLKTKFPAFQNPDAALALRASGLVSQEDFEKMRPMLDSALASGIAEMEKGAGGKAPDFVKKIVTDIFSTFIDTLKEGSIDGGTFVTLNDRFQMVSGGAVANGRKLDASLKELMGKVGSQADAPKIQFDAYKYQNVSFHLGRVNLPAGADQFAKKVLGEPVKFVVGTTDKAVYFALGDTSEVALKAFLDKNATAKLSETTPVDLQLKFRDILAYANTIQTHPAITSMLQTIEQFAENDRVSLSTKIVPRGILYRLTVEEGILRAAGAAAKSGRPGGGF